MADFHSLVEQHKNLSEKDQKKAGQAIHGKMQPQHYAFLKLITGLIESGSIDVFKPETFFHTAIYKGLDASAKAKVDQASVNIADQLRRVYDFFKSKQTPDESPQLQTMIEHLFQMKERIENEHGDVFKF